MRSRLFLRMHHAYLQQTALNGDALSGGVGFLKLLEGSAGGEAKESPSDVLTSVTAGMCLAIARTLGKDSK
jgi:hypothetical protein